MPSRLPPRGDRPAGPSQVLRRAQALRSMGRSEMAVDLLAEALRAAPESAWLHRAMSVSLLELDRYDEAIAAARAAIALKPDGWSMHTALSLAYINANRPADAVQPALEAVRIQPDVSFGHAWAAEALRRVGHLDHALASAQSAIAIDPERHRPLMARVLFSLGRWSDAEVECRRAYSRYPEDAYLAFFHSLALIAQRRVDEASAIQVSVLRRRPATLLARLLLERIESWPADRCSPNRHRAPLEPTALFSLEVELYALRASLLEVDLRERESLGRQRSSTLRGMPPATGR
jgi:tetratricopeptide (TPR) repeat protein